MSFQSVKLSREGKVAHITTLAMCMIMKGRYRTRSGDGQRQARRRRYPASPIIALSSTHRSAQVASIMPRHQKPLKSLNTLTHYSLRFLTKPVSPHYSLLCSHRSF